LLLPPVRLGAPVPGSYDVPGIHGDDGVRRILESTGFFYDHDEFIGQAIDLNSELPLSKIRLRMPEAKNRKIAEQAMRFCQKWI
jgi:hypothetical protein